MDKSTSLEREERGQRPTSGEAPRNHSSHLCRLLVYDARATFAWPLALAAFQIAIIYLYFDSTLRSSPARAQRRLADKLCSSQPSLPRTHPHLLPCSLISCRGDIKRLATPSSEAGLLFELFLSNNWVDCASLALVEFFIRNIPRVSF
jgi:hypothetical protein